MFVLLRSAPVEEKIAAWEFVRWMCDTEQTIAWSTRTGYLPITRPAIGVVSGTSGVAAILRQGLQIGVDHRMLDVGQRQERGLRRPGLRARQHQPIARRAGPPGTFHGEGRLPDAIHQAGVGRI